MKNIIPHIKKTVPKAKIHIITNGTMLIREVLWHIYPHIEKFTLTAMKKNIWIKLKNVYLLCEEEENNGTIEKMKFTIRRNKRKFWLNSDKNECGRSRMESLECSCVLPFNTLSVLPDGKINLCISDIKGSYLLGDVHTESLRDIRYGRKADDYRNKKVLGRKKLDLCKKGGTCSAFNKYMEENGQNERFILLESVQDYTQSIIWEMILTDI